VSRATSPDASPADIARALALLGEIAGKMDVLIALIERDRAPHPAAPEDALIGPRGIKAIVGLDLRTIRRHRAAGNFPTPATGGRYPRWRRADVERWLEARRS
jgi:predicted DNA-binding transcriptional regulator AlpA